MADAAPPLSPEEEAEVRRADAEFRRVLPYDRTWDVAAEGHRARLLATLDAARRASDAQVASMRDALTNAHHRLEAFNPPNGRGLTFPGAWALDHEPGAHPSGCGICAALAAPAPQPATPPLDERLLAEAMHRNDVAHRTCNDPNRGEHDREAAELAAEYARLAEPREADPEPLPPANPSLMGTIQKGGKDRPPEAEQPRSGRPPMRGE